MKVQSFKCSSLKLGDKMACLTIRTLAVLFCLITGIAGEVGAQIKDLKKIRLNVFRPDAATVAAKVRGLFSAEGLEVEISETPSSTDQMRGLSQGKFDMVSRLLRLSTRPYWRFLSGPRFGSGAISKEKSSRLTPLILRLHWFCGGCCWLTVWT